MLRSIRWRIAVPTILLLLVTLAGLSLYLSRFVRTAYTADLRAQLLSEARLAGDALADLPGDTTPDRLDSLADRWGPLLEARVTIMAADGTVLGDSHEDLARLDNHLSRPEVQEALASGEGSSTRFSATVGYDMLYAAVPVEVEGRVAAIVRVARPLRQVQVHTARLGRTILLVALGASLVAALLAVAMAGRITRPIRHLTQEAQRIAAGDLGRPVVADSGDEVAQLAHAFNRMGTRLQERMGRLAEEQRLLSTVLSRMADGAIITDAGGRVRLINPAAARLLESPKDAAVGRSFAQVARNHQLVDLWRAASEAGEPREATIEVLRPNLFLRAIVTPLDADSTGETLTIVQDLTQVRRLETVRRDFVSNISHELRNPLASLKALVETLRDGAIEDPEAAKRFLNSAETEVDALTQMVQELLELSRIESGRVSLHPEPVTAKALLARPAERLRPQAERAGVAIETAVPPDLPLALADVERLQQVIINIVHNAIKFTPAGGRISLSAQAAGNEVVLSIRDTGAGIPAKDLPRIFERFFKTDRARSGGGTGLGLAIAKHIVQAHGGRIWAESVEGRGSAFHIALPVTSEEGSDP